MQEYNEKTVNRIVNSIIALAILLLVMILLAPLVFAANKTFSWVAPTQREDNSALPTNQIAGYRVICTPQAPGNADLPATPLTFTRDFPPGSYSCVMHTRATDGQISGPSNAVNFTVPQSRPLAPENLSVND